MRSRLYVDRYRVFQSTPLVRGETTFCPVFTGQRHISIHSPRARGDVAGGRGSAGAGDFNPLPSCEGRPYAQPVTRTKTDFNPLPSCEGRPFFICKNTKIFYNFNPLPSCEGRHAKTHLHGFVRQFQSTPLVRGETQHGTPSHLRDSISIHSPRARGDLSRHFRSLFHRLISIHSPRARGDKLGLAKDYALRKISIHSPRARGDAQERRRVCHASGISIHSPRARGDAVERILDGEDWEFQSTPLVRGETSERAARSGTVAISIHSPRARGDLMAGAFF